MPPKPPDLKIPPAPPKAAKGRTAVIRKWLNSHPSIKKYWPAIGKWANEYGIDPLMYAILIWQESRGNPNARSNANAVGLVQIHLPSHPNITEAQARNPAFALKWGAEFFANKLNAAGGDYVKAYQGKGGYNPGGPNIFAGGVVPKGYVPSIGKLSVREQVEKTIQRRQIEESITGAQFKQAWDEINNIFYAYNGRNATRKEAEYLLKKGFSSYTLARALTKNKAFLKSPVWESKSPEYMEVAKSIFGDKIPPGTKVKSLIREAIVNRWSETTFASKLRESPSYFKSNEWKKGVTTLENKYREIYGEPNEEAMVAIKEATMGRWNLDQWEKYLRSKPEYYNSREFKNRQYEFMSMLGFLPTQNQNPQYQGPTEQLPDSKRIPNYNTNPAPVPGPKPPKPKKPKKKKPPTRASMPNKPPLENY